MQKQQVFKVKGMQRDLSMANTNGEFAHEIVNMRLIPAEENAGLSLTNEKGTLQIEGLSYEGTVIGQCPTNDSLVFFTCYPGNGTTDPGYDCIYELYQEGETWKLDQLFKGDLNFSIDNKIEAIFNYETLDIQKVYWIDGENQLRCINIAESPTNWGMVKTEEDGQWSPSDNINNQYFDSIKEIDSTPNVEIERVLGGSFTAGVVQYYFTYIKKHYTESPIVYTSPLLYIAHTDRGANTNDQVSTGFKFTLTGVDTSNWDYIRIYSTSRTSLDATPEASLIAEVPINGTEVIYTDYGNTKTSITPTDLYYIGGKWVKAGTMTVKDQVMFLGNLQTESKNTLDYDAAKSLFDQLRNLGDIDKFFSTETRKERENIISEYEGKYYYYKNQLNNTESITHYKYGEKYRFGIQLMDNYGVWSNPIWVKDAFILTPPQQTNESILEVPCPTLKVSEKLNSGMTLWEKLQSLGAKAIRPLVVFPDEDERKVIAQGVVCPTVYNLRDRKENGPYAQASWFMRPNAPVDLWGISSKYLGKENVTLFKNESGTELTIPNLSHKSDVISSLGLFAKDENKKEEAGYYGVSDYRLLNNELAPFDYLYDDFTLAPEVISSNVENSSVWKAAVIFTAQESGIYSWQFPGIYESAEQQPIYNKGTWVEFRHNYALRSKGFSFGYTSPGQMWNREVTDTMPEGGENDLTVSHVNFGMVRGAEIDSTDFKRIPHTNRFNAPEAKEIVLKYGDSTSPIILSNVYFATENDPLTVRDRVKKDKQTLFITVLYKHTFSDIDVTVVLPIGQIKITKAREDPSDVSRIKLWTELHTEIGEVIFNTRKKYTPYQLSDQMSALYYWNAGPSTRTSMWEIWKESIVKKYYNSITVRYSEENSLSYGDTHNSELSLGNASYYVDNSIITLNSPEIEIPESDSKTLSNTNFRIIGMIPLTATSSDISVEVTAPSVDQNNLGSGVEKRVYSNTNIGFHGFKGIVASNAYLSQFTDDMYKYGLVPLYPWQSTGTLGLYKNSNEKFGTNDLLKTKKLSNLRYSASTYYFPPDSLTFSGASESMEDSAYIENKKVGWKPTKGCQISSFTGEDSSSIIKLFNLGYTTQSLVYKGNVDSIAMLNKGFTNTPFESPIYTFGQYAIENKAEDTPDIEFRMNSPASGSIASGKCKTVGSSIKYKSSPHYVIGFNCFDSLWGSTQKIQETLPTIKNVNEEGLCSFSTTSTAYDKLVHNKLYEDVNVSSLYHQQYINVNSMSLGLPGSYIPVRSVSSSFDTSSLALFLVSDDIEPGNLTITTDDITLNPVSTIPNSSIQINNESSPNIFDLYIPSIKVVSSASTLIVGGEGGDSYPAAQSTCSLYIEFTEDAVKDIFIAFTKHLTSPTAIQTTVTLDEQYGLKLQGTYNNSSESKDFDSVVTCTFILGKKASLSCACTLEIISDEISVVFSSGLYLKRDYSIENNLAPNYGWLWLGEIYREVDPTFGGDTQYDLLANTWTVAGNSKLETRTVELQEETDDSEAVLEEVTELRWTIGDTYYQRFDTLKTYAYDDNAQNSVIDITSFMVETHINIDGRYDRNRGQESNLQMSPTNFNLTNDIYNQKDNFFSYNILDEDVQSRTSFPTQITWSLSKTAGETIDAWLNVTLASILDLDGNEGELKALKIFNNSIVAFQENGLSQILFNSRVQIPTSEMVPIQIANSGKVDGQQFISKDVGCQDKWNIVTTSLGLYFIDYYNKSIYRFNGQLEDLSSSKGFRGWCDKYINFNSTVIGYYDVKNREVMYYDSAFRCDELSDTPVWLGYSELTNNFSSFYTYPKSFLHSVKDKNIWLYNSDIYLHQEGLYNNLIDSNYPYGVMVVARQDSNSVKTFNNVEFRSDTYNSSDVLMNSHTVDTITIETEYQDKTSDTLTYSQYRPSNLKKKLRTWRANIPRENNGYNRFVNQWAKIGLWKKSPGNEKTILHDLAVWYSE